MSKKILSAMGMIKYFIPGQSSVRIKAYVHDSGQHGLIKKDETVELEIDRGIYDHLIERFNKKTDHPLDPTRDRFEIQLKFIHVR